MGARSNVSVGRQFFFYFRAAIFKNTFFFQKNSSKCFPGLLGHWLPTKTLKISSLEKCQPHKIVGAGAPQAPFSLRLCYFFLFLSFSICVFLSVPLFFFIPLLSIYLSLAFSLFLSLSFPLSLSLVFYISHSLLQKAFSKIIFSKLSQRIVSLFIILSRYTRIHTCRCSY